VFFKQQKQAMVFFSFKVVSWRSFFYQVQSLFLTAASDKK